MSFPVKLYVYDLSNGLAKQLSLQLTGKQIDGIWHTSVVVFGKEVFYGQGVDTTLPGRSHHGEPLQVVDMGETAIDEDTFNDYLQEMSAVYTADKYHLLDFNCNSFTNDCIGFLTGGSIPSWIKDLPSDFLSTPFGAALRPTIDSMYRRPTPGVAPSQPYNQPLAASLLQSVAAQAAGPSAETRGYLPTPATTPIPPSHAVTSQPAAASVAAPLQICSNLQHFRGVLSSHRAVAAFFTSRTCAPCKIVEPVFESLASDKAAKGVAFVKIDLSGQLGSDVASAYDVRATPTFLFFLDGQKVHELKGANAMELRTQVDLLIFQAFPHAAPTTILQEPDKARIRKILSVSTFPLLKTRFDAKVKATTPFTNMTKTCEDWAETTSILVKALPATQLFPLIDIWRLGLLDNSISTWCASASVAPSLLNATNANPVLLLLEYAASSISLPKPTLLTTLRLLSNVFDNSTLARIIINPITSSSAQPPRQLLTALLILSLLHDDASVRTAAASLAFNVAVHFERPRVEALRTGRRGEDIPGEESGEGDWEVEMVSAIIEALRTETANEDVVHRLTASLAFFLHLSPFCETQFKPLLEVLQVRDVLIAKLSGGPEGCGVKGVIKEEVRAVVKEVAEKLCS
ncbi:hypothetical protein EW145_g508 [Phellinidium pouzarii]|uniref:PPPDE domain-containing protein n=1 Tax=Phellinidium pouzarii TaxID=167371 RepID=A0A4S4LIP6_9AGAM|nr:hypothetical protein EW145_g508 [Phellinidium pouzarii]